MQGAAGDAQRSSASPSRGSQSATSDDLPAPPEKVRRSCDPGPTCARFGGVRGGSAEYYSSSSNLPPGPGNINELIAWPERLMQDIFAGGRPGGELCRRRCEAFLEMGEVLHTDFSGAGCPEMCKRMLQIAMRDHGLRLPDGDLCMSWRATDISAVSQSVFKDSTHRPVHLFGDIADRLAQKDRDHIHALRAPCTKAGRPLDLDEARKRHLRMDRYLKEGGKSIFPPGHTASCLFHPGGSCKVNFAQDSSWPRPLSSLIAGPMCIPWTSFGSQLGDSHPSLESFAVWLEGAAQARHDVVIMENNKWFPWERFAGRFAPQARVLRLVTGPERLGWPAARERLFLTALSHDTIIWMGPQTDESLSKHFHEIFGARSVLEADVFACDDDERVASYRKEIAARRAVYCERGISDSASFLSPSARDRLGQYKLKRQELEGMGGSFVCDLSQNPAGGRCIAGAWMPTCTQSSILLSLSATPNVLDGVRFFTPNEVAVSQGWPMVNLLGAQKYAGCVPKAIMDLPPSARQSLLGNGIHLVPMAAWMVYVAAHCVRREYFEGLAPTLQLRSDVADRDDLEDGEGDK